MIELFDFKITEIEENGKSLLEVSCVNYALIIDYKSRLLELAKGLPPAPVIIQRDN